MLWHKACRTRPPSNRRDRAEFRRVVVGAARLALRQRLDQAAAGVAGIDDVVDAEALGGAQHADAHARLLDHLLAAGGRIGRGLVLLAEGDVDGAFDRHGADLRRRPGKAGVGRKAAAAVHGEVAEAVALAQDDRDARHAGVAPFVDQLGAAPAEHRALGGRADRESPARRSTRSAAGRRRRTAR